LADVALATRVIASHYAEPLGCVVECGTALRRGPAENAPEIRALRNGEPFEMLDDSLGWAWGYAGQERRVGYVRSDTLGSVNH
jgi:hypothetical protein